MEDALVPLELLKKGKEVTGLNPCFNGRCTRTQSRQLFPRRKQTGLNPCFNGRCTRTVSMERNGAYVNES